MVDEPSVPSRRASAEHASSASDNLAANVRQLREARGLSQQRMATLSGIPRATWATVEAGGSNPTLAVLLKLAGALHVSLEELVGRPRATGRLVSRAQLRGKRRGRVQITDLLPDPLPGMQLERMAIPAGAGMTGVPHTPGTREYLCCETGEVTLMASGESWTLSPGDVLVFRGDQKHSYRNLGSVDAVAYSAVVLAPG